jgi:hypothetical protein
MSFEDREVPGDGTLAAVFRCDSCGRSVAMLTNPMETQLVSSLGVEIGGREVPSEPMEATRGAIEEPRIGGSDAKVERRADEDGASSAADAGSATPDGGEPGDGDRSKVEWTDAAARRLDRVPSFVRGMVHRIYTDWARERGIREITPEVMDRARTDLGLEGM